MTNKHAGNRVETEEPEDTACVRPMRVIDFIVPVGGVAFSVYYMSTVWELPQEARSSGLVVTALIFVFCGIFFVREAVRFTKFGFEWGGGDLFGRLAVALRRIAIIFFVIVYIYFLPIVGFVLTTLLFLVVSMAVLGVRNIKQLLMIPASLSLIGYFLFIEALGARLPQGYVDNLLGSIVGLVGL